MTDLAPADAQITGVGPSPSGWDETLGPAFPGLLSLGAAVGLAMMVITSTGDALVAGVLLGVAADDLVAGSVGVLVGIAGVGRWGSSSLAALAGGQAVLGAGGWSGPAGMVVSSWAAAAAVVLVCSRRAGSASTPEVPVGILASGLLAAALVAGPAVGQDTGSVVTLRVVASVVAVAVAVLVVRACPPRATRVAGVIAAVSAAALAVLA